MAAVLVSDGIIGEVNLSPGGVTYYKGDVMTISAFSVPLKPPTPKELEYNRLAAESSEYHLSPIDEAVQAVQEAQDSVGKTIWEN